ncbi:MAG TPA: hypothetical protein VER39_17955, partial [Nocardioidaceae bacterium]|nr:hypothetical protein [Nocardioidaceae bacterium]
MQISPAGSDALGVGAVPTSGVGQGGHVTTVPSVPEVPVMAAVGPAPGVADGQVGAGGVGVGVALGDLLGVALGLLLGVALGLLLGVALGLLLGVAL